MMLIVKQFLLWK